MKRMTPSPTPSAAAVIEAFAGIPGLLEQAPALMARGRAKRGRDRRQRYYRGTTRSFSDEREPRAISSLYCAVLSEILKQSTTSTKQGAHV
ncbi:MAG: hypothetical protein Q8M18_16550 [Bradyrhizobium sp.]|nr:hypothetical protein [Bradyrhizobium sp.]